MGIRQEKLEGEIWLIYHEVEIELPYIGSTALVTRTPVVLGRSEVDRRTISSSQGILPLEIGPEPIIVEVEP